MGEEFEPLTASARHGVAPPRGFDAVPTGDQGLWLLRRNGEVIGSIGLVPDALALPSLHVLCMIHGLNNPPMPEAFRPTDKAD